MLGNDKRLGERKKQLNGKRESTIKVIRKEAGLFIGLLFVGLVLLPIAVYSVGQNIFGDYGGHGYGQFFATLSGRIRDGDAVAWFLVLSPYLGWQTLRLMALGWRLTARPNTPRS